MDYGKCSKILKNQSILKTEIFQHQFISLKNMVCNFEKHVWTLKTVQINSLLSYIIKQKIFLKNIIRLNKMS